MKTPSRSVGETLVLCYHAVSDTWPTYLAVVPDQLERQLKAFLKQGFEPVTFLDAIKSAGSAGRRMAVTFDDGYRSVCKLAHPILDRLGIPGTIFVPTGHIGECPARGWDGTARWRETQWASELTLASWDELADLVAAGWEIGSHTRGHPHLTEVDDRTLARELEGSRLDCEQHLGAPCLSLAYPYGEVDDKVRSAAARSGYVAAACLSGRLPTRAAALDRLLWPRLTVNRGETRARLFAKTWLYRHCPRGWNAAQAMRVRGQPTRAGAVRWRPRGGGSATW